MSPAPPRESPYVGLRAYEDADAEFFFGRERETALVAMNLRASRLTILHGPSGVGKSSLLRAGVVHNLRSSEHGRRAAGTSETEGADESRFVVCVFPGEPDGEGRVPESWRDDPVDGVREAARKALEPADAIIREGSDMSVTHQSSALPLAETFRKWIKAPQTLLIVLDQFEEYFNRREARVDERLTFAAELALIVNDPTLSVNVLISIRDDAWAKLDRLKGQIPSLFANSVRLDHLDRKGATQAIEWPIEMWNRKPPEREPKFEIGIEEQLVETLLDATAAGRLTLLPDSGPQPTTDPRDDPAGDMKELPPGEAPRPRIEAPFLQLVLDRLWHDTTAEKVQFRQRVLERVWRDPHPSGRRTLALAQLEAIGGAHHILAVIAALATHVWNRLLKALGRPRPGADSAAGHVLDALGRRKPAGKKPPEGEAPPPTLAEQGVRRVIENHVVDALDHLSLRERNAAAVCFGYLVTSGKTKDALSPEFLAKRTGLPVRMDTPESGQSLPFFSRWRQTPVDGLLNKLCEPCFVLRKVTGDRYELYHDILIEPILDWCRRRKLLQRTRRLIVAVVVLLLLVAGLAIGLVRGHESQPNQVSIEVKVGTKPDQMRIAVTNPPGHFPLNVRLTGLTRASACLEKLKTQFDLTPGEVKKFVCYVAVAESGPSKSPPYEIWVPPLKTEAPP